MTDKAVAKANERANRAAGNVSVRGWIPSEDTPDFNDMVQRAEERVGKRNDGEADDK